MSQDSESDDDGYMCMELPTLIKQLKSVLDQYPDDGQILRELIQNAEDAEASEIRILYDDRQIDPDPRLLKKKYYLASLQAPGLCVYNDALFTKKDWKGIKMLHDSVKQEEVLKVGRFGLGFKSVFHVTDFPSVISGDTVLFINPHEKNSDRVCYMKKLHDLPSGVKKMILNIFSGIFGFTSETADTGHYPGTIFWFPLRSNISKLSDNLYTEKKVMDLFQAFKAEASVTLLFLKSIEKIQLYRRLGEKTETQFSLQLSHDCLQHIRTEKKDFMTKVKQIQGEIPPSSLQSELCVNVEIEDVADTKYSQSWIVIYFYKGGSMTERFRALCHDTSLSYSPFVGLAVPLGQQCEGRVFCFLPLPLQSHSHTGLQVHVNGFFALNQNRRHVKWPTADQLQNQAHTDKAIEWNKCLVTEVLPEVYCSLVDSLLQCCNSYDNSITIIQQVYRTIPDVDDVDVHWKPLVSKFLAQLHNISFLFTPSDQKKGITMKDAFLVDVANDACSLITEIFTLYGRYIVPVPTKLMRTLEKHFSSHTHKATPKDVCDILKVDNRFTTLPREKKLMLLKYLLKSDEYKHLDNLCLLPVSDGNFVEFGAPTPVFICYKQQDAKLFPGLESRIVSFDLPEDLRQALLNRATGGWQGLFVMSPAAFPILLMDCLLRHFPEGNAELPFQSLDVNWLRQVWTYVTAHGIDVETHFSGFPIMPDIDVTGRGKLLLIDEVFIAQSIRHSESLPQNVGASLQKLGIIHLMYVPDFVLNNPHVLGTIIQYSTPVGVVRALETVYTRKHNTVVQLFNSKCSQEERSALVTYMSSCQLNDGTKAVLRKLELFTATDNSNCSVDTLCTLAPDEQIPVPYPQRCIQCSCAEVKDLALKLGATATPFLHVCQQILQMMHHGSLQYTETQKVEFMEFLMHKHMPVVKETRQIVSALQFLSSSGGSSGLTACDLFSQDDPFLTAFFLEEDKFPAERHTRTDRLRKGLQVIGLKTVNEISESDVRTSAKRIEELVNRGMDSEAEMKVTAFITFLKRNIDRMDPMKLSDLQHHKCVPCLQKKISRYPMSLTWNGESGPSISSSGEVFSSRYSSIIGSVSPVAKEMTEAVERILGLCRVPPVRSVMDHLHNLGISYDSRECNLCMELLKDIYSFLNSPNISIAEKNHQMQSTRSVWVGIEEGFQYPRSVYIERSETDLDLKPYRYQLPSLLYDWRSLLSDCGCHQRQTPDMLTTVLEEIKQKHDEFRFSNFKKPTDVRQDLNLVLQILNELQEHAQRYDVLVPVHQASEDFLLLLPAEQCTYCNADWLQDQMSHDTAEDEEEEIFYVHSRISERTAQLVGVYTLTERVMDDTEDFDMEYHQSEPLTRRLKNILRDYTDGFSVPKELIQNADDASATEVCFMYDERQNLNARTFLMNENMADLQGPALWAYNNASFTRSDFNNLRKLSGATKEEDTTKVGKFGLGFSSVYNLTDVPSFISENTLVIFDPHKSYLGKPGLKANLKSVKNQRMMRNMKGQLKPFEGIFGCQVMKEGKRDTICHGTLFRFPLRTPEQAATSEIKDLSYSRHEMETFFRKFAEGCGNITLFTQHVSSVKFFYLPRNGDPNMPELLIHVAKAMTGQRILSPPNSLLNGRTVLSYATQEWNAHSGESLKITEKSDVQLEICDTDMTRTQTLNPGVTTQSWVITWVTGQKESKQFALSGKLKGLLPIAAVAIPLTLEGGRHIYDMSTCPAGFYREGHFFCFLPLPVHIPFPVHINAPFALTTDRKQLCTQIEDDKMNTEAEWNTALFNDATCRAYIAGLEQLEITDPSSNIQYYDLWPITPHGTHDSMVQSFYELIIDETHCVFPHDNNGTLEWLPFKGMFILEPKLRWNDDIGMIAFKATSHFLRSTNRKMVDLPLKLFEQFCLSRLQSRVTSRLITTLEFFKTIFFPNMHDSYWSTTERDSLVLFALKYQNEGVEDLIRSSRCIPTEPSGTLKMPCELIHPYKQCARMFSEDDERFPRGFSICRIKFCDQRVVEILCEHGMIQDELPWELLVERASSVGKLEKQNSKTAHERSGQILKYLGSEIHHGAKHYVTCPKAIQSELQDISFLPVQKRPSSWPLTWKADDIEGNPFARPTELYMDSVSSLVASSKLILADHFYPYVRVDMDVLSWLGVKGTADVDLDVVSEQLLLVSKSINALTDDSPSYELSKLCKDIYKFLNYKCGEGDAQVEMIRQRLQHQETVLVGKQMIEPKHVAFHLPADLSPYLYQVDVIIAENKNLLQSIGVKDKFEVSDLLLVMQEISRDAGSKELSEDQLKWFGRTTQYLSEFDKSCFGEERFDVSLPNCDRFLSKATSLCFDDYEFADNNETMKFVHACVHHEAAKLLGVKGKRAVHLKAHISHFSSPFGQKEKLTTRLKRILSVYPRDSSIMKELLQNADDAGATELMFVKDFRQLPKEKIFSDEWASLQGPALCVYNDSYFTEDDLEGIQNLGVGSKSEDAVKTGQYGVGFNAVYHLTDVPTFITVGPEMEKSICALDPHMQYVEAGKTGMKISQLDRLRATYSDSFSGYLEDIVKTDPKGTLFRFPLRTRKMAKTSEIAKKEVTTNEVNKLLREFKNDMFDSLLFLYSVKKISVASVNTDGSFKEEYSVTATMSAADMSAHEGFLSHLRKQTAKIRDPSAGIGLDAVSSLEAELALSVEDSEGRHQDWVVFHHSGFSKEKPIPEPVNEAWENGNICLLPQGGVAVQIAAGGKSVQPIMGKAFCTLPLPITTGLPVHVNGRFALDHEARRNLWHGDKDYRSIWNRHVVDAIIIPAYIMAVQSLKKRTGIFEGKSLRCQYDSLNHYYSFFPEWSSETTGVWNDVVTSFYEDVFLNKRTIFGIVKPENGMFSDFCKNENLKKEDMASKVFWVSAARGKGYFNVLEGFFTQTDLVSQSDTDRGKDLTVLYPQMPQFKQENERAWQLTEILKDLNMTIIDVPCRIYKNMKDICSESELDLVTPESVMHFLKSHSAETKNSCNLESLPRELEDTSLKSVKSLQLLTKFCEMHTTFGSELQSLPLALTESQQLHCFDADKSLFVTMYTDLFCRTPDEVLDRRIRCGFQKYLKESDCIKDLDVASLACLTEKTFSRDVLYTGKPVPWEDSEDLPTKKWIYQFWDCLSQQMCSVEDKETFDTQTFLAELEGWSLLPVRIEEQGKNIPFLYPISKGKCVIFNPALDDKCATVLKNMKVPVLERDFFHEFSTFCQNIMKVTSSVAAKMEHPDEILKLLSGIDFSDALKITAEDSLAVLEYFSVNIKKLSDLICEQPALQLLRKLPFHQSMCGQQVALQDDNDVLAVEYCDHVPSDGFSALIRTSCKALIKKHVQSRGIYEKLHIKTLTREDLYVQIILPNFECMPSSAQLRHLEFIRDVILVNMEELGGLQKPMEDELRKLRFIETGEGIRQCANKFYSPHEEIFKHMCSTSEFPPSPYDEEEWKTFLEIAGLTKDVSTELYLNFARKVESLGSTGITEDVSNKSKVLSSYLAKHHGEFQGHLPQIGKIKFVLPHTVEQKLTDIHPQLHGGKQLVAYCESLHPKNCHCIWTSCSMFHKNACPWDLIPQADHFSELGIRAIPSSSDVTSHLQNICSSFKKLQDQNSVSKLCHKMESVMKSVYKHLKEEGVKECMKHQLQNFCTVYLPEEKCMVLASEVVMYIHSADIVEDYVYAMPYSLREFDQVLLSLGASKKAHANLYARVLEKLYKKTQSLKDKDLFTAVKAINKMFEFIKNENKANSPTLNVPTLYLPDAKWRLTDSRQLVFIDNDSFSERVQSLDLQYFLGFDKGFPYLNRDPQTHINMLPAHYQLKMLSSLVHEVVAEEMKLKACPHDLSEKYLEIIHDPEFVCAIVRLINHTRVLRHTESLDQSEARTIEEQLWKLEIHEVQNLQTELRQNDGNQVPHSEKKRSCIEEHFNAKVYLFTDNDIDTDELCAALVLTIDSLTSKRLGASSSHINHLLKSDPETYKEYLDEQYIRPYYYECQLREDYSFPIPGRLIPEAMHWRLGNSFHDFDEWEYVGLEVYDPVVDTDAPDEDGKPEYVYALVKKILSKESVLVRGQYLVALGKGHLETVCGSRLYKIMSENNATTETPELPEVTPRDLNTVLKEIRHILTDTWRTFSNLKERRRVVKRLYLTWHPDKNIGNEDICTIVCQYIQSYVTKLENGQSIAEGGDVPADDGHAESSFFEHMSKRSSHQRSQYQRHQNHRDTSYNRHHSAYPQPEEAGQWLRQATCDLRSARDTLQLGRDYNWVCFKALKAAEKAVISAWYNRDARKAKNRREKGIIKAASGLKNERLSTLVTWLQNVVGDDDRMLYPDKHACRNIPADVYTENTARQACELAEHVLKLAKDM
ncbi:sacsin-like [Haliotis asinina]|uniref:sacsin-like n=1 Tax=Haliotis asinina TaxID=109174 RepID=UPI0035327F3F